MVEGLGFRVEGAGLLKIKVIYMVLPGFHQGGMGFKV